MHGIPYNIPAGFYRNRSLRNVGHVAGIYLPGNRLWRLRDGINRLFQSIVVSDTASTVVHQTAFNFRPFRRARVVVTVHDMIDELFLFPEGAKDPKAIAKKKSCDQADQIIAISKSTKADLVRLFNIDPGKIAVVHLGNSITQYPTGLEKTAGNERPFLLYVGNRASYKNFDRLVRALGNSHWLRSEFDLICFGGGPFTQNERHILAGAGIDSIVRHVAGDDIRLAEYYRKAAALIYPSCYEGFGLPLIEAMAQGCPVICSGVSSMPEVGGNAAVYFEPTDVDSIQTTVEKTLGDPTLMKEMSRRGLEHHGQFTWKRCFQETMAVYHKALGSAENSRSDLEKI